MKALTLEEFSGLPVGAPVVLIGDSWDGTVSCRTGTKLRDCPENGGVRLGVVRTDDGLEVWVDADVWRVSLPNKPAPFTLENVVKLNESVMRAEIERYPLPKDAAKRKGIPIATGFIDYFPDAIAAVAELSRIGNDQHNPGKPLFWDRSKSGDESDALMRHFLERGSYDTDGVRHSAKVAWRALALLQKEIESDDQASS